MSPITPPPPPSVPSPQTPYRWRDGYLEENCPTLFEYLAAQWANAAEREPGRLLLFSNPVGLTGLLVDVQYRRKTFWTADGLMNLLDGLDEALEMNRVSWQPDVRTYTVHGSRVDENT